MNSHFLFGEKLKISLVGRGWKEVEVASVYSGECERGCHWLLSHHHVDKYFDLMMLVD